MTADSIPPLAELRKRQSAKWRTFPDDVLPLPVAEMDFPLAAPVAKALHEAVDRSDTGYAAPTRDLADAVSGYARRAWDWTIDADDVRTVADVGIGIVEVLRRVVAAISRFCDSGVGDSGVWGVCRCWSVEVSGCGVTVLGVRVPRGIAVVERYRVRGDAVSVS
ncbi:hypothetical protein [Streptomyces sp. NPDC000410]|uniref:hypothetical protein n=1 Tax=Streptomyces sp. NPDC000410 TaxID=3154254 RepID=UPI00331A11F5